jgi:hypothetical protein
MVVGDVPLSEHAAVRPSRHRNTDDRATTRFMLTLLPQAVHALALIGPVPWNARVVDVKWS